MDLLARLAIRRQLHWLLLAVIAILFLVAALWFSVDERRAYHQRATEEMALVAKVVATSIAPAVLYGAERSAEETLLVLSASPAVEVAAVFDSSGEIFVRYLAEHADHQSIPAPGSGAEAVLLGNHHALTFPIYLQPNSRPVGHLYLRGELVGLEAHMQRYFLNQGAVLLCVLLVAYLFGIKIEQAIVEPYRQQNRQLELLVEKRTAQLQQTNQQMAQEIEERKGVESDLTAKQREQAKLIKKLEEAHNQLLQSEKMASVGQLAAGVAHEINNPVGFINSNLGTLQQYFDDLLIVLQAYEQAEPALTGEPALLQAIEEAKQAADLDYLKDDIGDLLKESRDGVERVKRIVQDLKDFSRSDQGQLEWSDLHQGLDSTLNVAWNELKYKCEVIKEYGQLPHVNCRQSQLNQVFMNLLVNAAQAIAEKGTVTIRTGQEGEKVWVEVEDTGKGISDENLKRVFDPFFTTKPVGKGTGLGLSLSYGIVQKHGGEIEVHSQLGVGTRFRVWLPVDAEPYAETSDMSLALAT